MDKQEEQPWLRVEQETQIDPGSYEEQPWKLSTVGGSAPRKELKPHFLPVLHKWNGPR